MVETGAAGEELKPNKKFRVSKFLNEVPTFVQDKRGLNIPTLIIQVFFLLARKKFDDAIQRIEALAKYNSRHLKKGDNFRTACFIKMLEIAAKQGFQVRETEQNVKSLFIKMTGEQIVFANQSAELEYIPYHHLWEHGMEEIRRVA